MHGSAAKQTYSGAHIEQISFTGNCAWTVSLEQTSVRDLSYISNSSVTSST